MADTDDDKRKKLTYDEAVALLPDGDMIHTFVSTPGMLIGADWPREDILELLRTGLPELSGKMAMSMNHGIVAFQKVEGDKLYDPLFISTKEK